MTFYTEKEQLYPETDTLCFGLGASQLQIRNGMQFPRNETPENTEMQPVAFACGSLTSMETLYRNMKEKHYAYSIA